MNILNVVSSTRITSEPIVLKLRISSFKEPDVVALTGSVTVNVFVPAPDVT